MRTCLDDSVMICSYDRPYEAEELPMLPPAHGGVTAGVAVAGIELDEGGLVG